MIKLFQVSRHTVKFFAHPPGGSTLPEIDEEQLRIINRYGIHAQPDGPVTFGQGAHGPHTGAQSTLVNSRHDLPCNPLPAGKVVRKPRAVDEDAQAFRATASPISSGEREDQRP